MSLVNDMLKDLDRRQAPDQNPAPAAVGYGSLTKARERALPLPLTFAVVVGVLVLVVALLWYFRGFFTDSAGQEGVGDSAGQSGAIERQVQSPELSETGRTAESIVENIGDSNAVLTMAAAKLEPKSNTPMSESPESDPQIVQEKATTPQPSAVLHAAVSEPVIQESGKTVAEVKASVAADKGKTQAGVTAKNVVEVADTQKVGSKTAPARAAVATTAAGNTALEISTTDPDTSASLPAKQAPSTKASTTAANVAKPSPEVKAKEVAKSGLNKVVVKTPEQQDAAIVEEARSLLAKRGAMVSRSFLNENIPQLEYHDGSSELLVLLMIQSGDVEQALLALQRFPVRSSVLDAQLRARVLQSQGNIEGAIALLQKLPVAVAEAPEHHVMLAVLYQQSGRYADAVTEYAGLVGVDDSVGNWWAGLGMALEGVGQPAAAQRAYGRSKQLSNLSPELGAYIAKRLDYLQAQNWN